MKASPATDSAEKTRGATFYAFAAGVPIFLVFVAATYAYAAWGDRFIGGLSEGIGELISQRATNLAAAGLNEQAIATYRQALAERFEDEPKQRVLTMQRLAKLLLAERQPEAAVDVMEKAVTLDMGSGPSYSLLYSALRAAKNTERALAVTREWYAASKRAGDAAGAKWAKYNEGAIYRDMEKYQDALAAFTESNALQQSQESALQCALLLRRLGRPQEAMALADYVVRNGDSTYAQQAQALLKSIQEASAAGQLH